MELGEPQKAVEQYRKALLNLADALNRVVQYYVEEIVPILGNVYQIIMRIQRNELINTLRAIQERKARGEIS
jgi:hypothetical protein